MIGQQEKRLDEKKQAYDKAQQLGEAVEVMGDTEGWRKHFIPKIQKMHDDAQEIVNQPNVSEREADRHRGIIETCRYVLRYAEDKKKQALTIMQKSTTHAPR